MFFFIKFNLIKSTFLCVLLNHVLGLAFCTLQIFFFLFYVFFSTKFLKLNSINCFFHSHVFFCYTYNWISNKMKRKILQKQNRDEESLDEKHKKNVWRGRKWWKSKNGGARSALLRWVLNVFTGRPAEHLFMLRVIEMKFYFMILVFLIVCMYIVSQWMLVSFSTKNILFISFLSTWFSASSWRRHKQNSKLNRVCRKKCVGGDGIGGWFPYIVKLFFHYLFHCWLRQKKRIS